MPENNAAKFVRELSLMDAIAIGLGTMISAGIFVLSSVAAEKAGPAATLSFVVAGLLVLPTALSISELATGMPEAGGSYHIISRALGPLAGAIVGPGNWLGLTFATGFYLIGFGEYVAYLAPIPPWLTAVISGLFFGYLNYRGAKLSGRVQNYIVAVLLLILGYFAIRASFNLDRALHQPFAPYGWGPVVANVGLVIVCYLGFEKISTIAAEVKRPKRTLPLAIIGSVVIATSLYAAILFTTTGIISHTEITEYRAPLVEAARRMMSVSGVVGISTAALLATASSANAAIMASSRINFAMGRDGILPPWFGKINARFHTPSHAILITTALSIALAISGQAEILAEIASALFMVSYALLALSLIVVRRAQPSWYRPGFHAPFFPWLTAGGGLLALAIIFVMKPISQITGLGLVVISAAYYWSRGRLRTDVEGALVPWMERERPLDAVIANVQEQREATRNEILVPVANPKTAGSLVRLAAALVLSQKDLDSRVVALKVVPVPVNLPLSVARHYLQSQNSEHKEILQLAFEAGAETGVLVDTLLRAAHNIDTGIIAVARNRPETRLILLGWHGPLSLSRIRTSIDKKVVRSSPTDVAVLLDRGLSNVRRILIPAGGGPHARLGMRLAKQLMLGNQEGEITVVRVAPPDETIDYAMEKQAIDRLIGEELDGTKIPIRERVVQAASVVAGVLNAAGEGYDLIIIGASEQWFLHNWLFGAIPDRIAEQAPCSVLLVKKHEPWSLSWFRRKLKQIGSSNPV